MATALLLTACGPGPGEGEAKGSDRNGPRPTALAGGEAGGPRLPVPRGRGSRMPDDFNGDGLRDLVLDDLVHDRHGDDAGIGIAYNTGEGPDPAARQVLTPARNAARTAGELPAAFDTAARCDLDRDGFTDLVISTDPPYDGQGRPPVPLQLLFGSPRGLTGKAVRLRIPEAARDGNDWPDQPVCGDFDGDGAQDLVVHASNAQLGYLRGPFTREGAPRAGKLLPAPGADLASPSASTDPAGLDVDGDGYDDLLVRTGDGTGRSTLVRGGPTGPARAGVTFPAGGAHAFGRFDAGRALDAAIGSASGLALRYDPPGPRRATLKGAAEALHAADLDGDGLAELIVSGAELRILHGAAEGLTPSATLPAPPSEGGRTEVLTAADFDGDRRADLVLRTTADGTKDRVHLYRGTRGGGGRGGGGGGGVTARPSLTFTTATFVPQGD